MQVEPFFTAVPDLQLEARQGFYIYRAKGQINLQWSVVAHDVQVFKRNTTTLCFFKPILLWKPIIWTKHLLQPVVSLCGTPSMIGKNTWNILTIPWHGCLSLFECLVGLYGCIMVYPSAMSHLWHPWRPQCWFFRIGRPPDGRMQSQARRRMLFVDLESLWWHLTFERCWTIFNLGLQLCLFPILPNLTWIWATVKKNQILQAPTIADGWDEGTQLAPLRSDGAAHDRTCAAWGQVRTSDARKYTISMVSSPVQWDTDGVVCRGMMY